MNENDDVMSFNNEPDLSMQNYDIPEMNTSGEQENTDFPAEKNEYGNENDFKEDYGDSFVSENNQNMVSGDLNGNAYEESSEELQDNKSQSKMILDTEASVKTASSKNKGIFLNRQRILLILSGVFVIFILFFTFVYPVLTDKKKKKESVQLEKNGKNYIPSYIKNELDNNVSENRIENKIYTEENERGVFVDGNSSYESELDNKENFEERFPSPGKNVSEKKGNDKQERNVAPVQIPSSGNNGSSSEVPLTNRNEQQKQLQRLSLEKTYSPSEMQRSAGAKYATVKPDGYSTGYNSMYTGTNTQTLGSYTPVNLSNNIERYLASQGAATDSYSLQNNQTAKQEFFNQKGIGGQFQWNSEYSLWKGSVVSIVLDTAINSDLPGSVMGHVTRNVYTSQDGKYLLIPMGSRVFGEYSSSISYGQNRVQVVWNTLIRPDGLEVNLGSMNGIDAFGASGYKGWKTEHPFEYLKAFGLIAAYSILDTKAMKYTEQQTNEYAKNVLTDVYGETKRLNNKIVDRAMDIQPTIKIKSGTEINLITNVTIDLPPLEPYDVVEKYVRK